MSVFTYMFARMLFVTVLSTASGVKTWNNTKGEGEEGPSSPVQNLSLPESNTTVKSSINSMLKNSTTTPWTTKQLKSDSTHKMSVGLNSKSSKPTTQPSKTSVNFNVYTGRREHSVQSVEKRKRVVLPIVLPVLGFIFIVVVFMLLLCWIRRKKTMKIKEGFQEEMASICLHDELALESLYASWKPFTETKSVSEVKLVLEVSG